MFLTVSFQHTEAIEVGDFRFELHRPDISFKAEDGRLIPTTIEPLELIPGVRVQLARPQLTDLTIAFDAPSTIHIRRVAAGVGR